jgi:hypothetical protein
MAGHSYTISGHKRTDVAKWLGMAAAISAAPISALLTTFVTHTLFPVVSKNWAIASFAISAGAIYWGLYWLFNKWAWRIAGQFLSIPNLSGEWTVSGKTLDAEGDTRFDWGGTLVISQKWDNIEIHQRTKESGSHSYTALITPSERGEVTLAYGYANTPDVAATSLHRHDGFCEITFDRELQSGSGRYFTSRERGTFGSMLLQRKS